MWLVRHTCGLRDVSVSQLQISPVVSGHHQHFLPFSDITVPLKSSCFSFGCYNSVSSFTGFSSPRKGVLTPRTRVSASSIEKEEFYKSKGGKKDRWEFGPKPTLPTVLHVWVGQPKCSSSALVSPPLPSQPLSHPAARRLMPVLTTH